MIFKYSASSFFLRLCMLLVEADSWKVSLTNVFPETFRIKKSFTVNLWFLFKTVIHWSRLVKHQMLLKYHFTNQLGVKNKWIYTFFLENCIIFFSLLRRSGKKASADVQPICLSNKELYNATIFLKIGWSLFPRIFAKE